MSHEQQPREADDLMPGQGVAKVPAERATKLPRASGIYQILGALTEDRGQGFVD